jgi:hypothetical protein
MSAIATAAKAAGISYDDAAILQTASVDFLLAAARGRIDLNGMARAELASRGLGPDGKWVGFDAAAALESTTQYV